MNHELDPTEGLLRENVRLNRENNKILRKLWRAQVLSFWSRVLFVLILIGVPVFFYQYYLSDTIQELQGIFTNIRETVTDLGGAAEDLTASVLAKDLKDILDAVE